MSGPVRGRSRPRVNGAQRSHLPLSIVHPANTEIAPGLRTMISTFADRLREFGDDLSSAGRE